MSNTTGIWIYHSDVNVSIDCYACDLVLPEKYTNWSHTNIIDISSQYRFDNKLKEILQSWIIVYYSEEKGLLSNEEQGIS